MMTLDRRAYLAIGNKVRIERNGERYVIYSLNERVAVKTSFKDALRKAREINVEITEGHKKQHINYTCCNVSSA